MIEGKETGAANDLGAASVACVAELHKVTLLAQPGTTASARLDAAVFPVMHPSSLQHLAAPAGPRDSATQQGRPRIELVSLAEALAQNATLTVSKDGDALRARDLCRPLQPHEKLVIGKYVPDPAAGDGGSGVGGGKKRKKLRGRRPSGPPPPAPVVACGTAGAAVLRLRRQSTGAQHHHHQQQQHQPRASGGSGDDGDNSESDSGGGGGDGEDRQPRVQPPVPPPTAPSGGSTATRPVRRQRRQRIVGDLSESETDNDNNGGAPSAAVRRNSGGGNAAAAAAAAPAGGGGGGRAEEAVLPQQPLVTHRLLAALHPFPIAADTLYFPVHYGAPSAKERDDPRGTPLTINAAIHGDPHDDIALHLRTRAQQQQQRPLFRDVEVQRGNLNRVPLFRIGPNAVAFRVVVNAFEASGAQFTPHSNWNIMWAKRATPELLARLGPYQKINHFPGTWGIGRKDSLHRNIARMRKLFGAAAFDIVPAGFICPQDEALLRDDVLQATPLPTPQCPNPSPPTYICKPVASSCGKGITLSRGLPATLPTASSGKSIIVQRYIGNPYLVDGRKFDLRVYCVVTGFNPLRVYLFDQGLVRFAAERYPGPGADLGSAYKHLTNYSVNKTAQLARESKGRGADSDEPVDIKWALSDFREHLRRVHGDAEGAARWGRIFAAMQDVVVKALLSIEDQVNARLRNECRDPTGRGCFELFGLDLMLDDAEKVYLIEANIMPSLATGTSLDRAVKARMLAHMLTMVGVVPYARRDAAQHGDDAPAGTGVSMERYFYSPPPGAKRPAASPPSTAGSGEAAKRHFVDAPPLRSFDVLTPAEKMMLLEADEEHARRGGFTRIFPTPETRKRYFGLFPEGVSRNNYLLASWIEANAAKGK